MDDFCTPQLVAVLDVEQDPPVVTDVYVSYNSQNARADKPRTAILTQLTGFNRTEARRAMGALIWGDPKYKWVILRYGIEDDLLRLHPDNFGKKDIFQYGYTYQMHRDWVAEQGKKGKKAESA